MRSVEDASRGVLLLALLVFALLFGRPLYWGVLSHLEPDMDDDLGPDMDDDTDEPMPIIKPRLPHGVVARPKSLPSAPGTTTTIPNTNTSTSTPELTLTTKPGSAGEGAQPQGEPAPSSPASASTGVSPGDTAGAAAASSAQGTAAGGEGTGGGGAPGGAAGTVTAGQQGTAAAGGAAAGAAGAAEADPSSLAKGVRAIVHEGRPLLEALKRPVWEQPPAGTAFPGKEEFALRREMVEQRATRDGFVLVTFANFAFMDFVINWVQHLTEQGVSNVLVGAMDTKLLEALFFRGVPVFDMESGLQPQDAGWGSPVFHKMGREKVTLVNVFLAMGFNLLICDTDAVFLRDPLPYMRRFPDADVLMSSDNLARTVEDDDLESFKDSHGAYNIGILLFRATPAAKALSRAWAEQLAGDDSIWDQNGFNDLMRRRVGPSVEGGSSTHLFWAFDGRLKAGILPVSVFCSGHTYFIQRLYSVVKIPAYAIHTTFQFSGTPGKRHRLREALHFRDPPEYYDPPGGVLSFSAKVPAGLLRGGKHNLTTHFNLMNYQLRQLRVMMALALVLNRTLVFPEIWARYDSQYFPHAGTVENTDTAQPLIVPLDHLLQVNVMLPGVLSPVDMGLPFQFREYSFLDNPAVPPELKASRVEVILCKDDRPAAAAEEVAAEPGSLPEFSSRAAADAAAAAESFLPCTTRLSSPRQVLLPLGSSTGQIVAALKPYAGYKWLDFSSHVEHLISSWDDKDQQTKFYRRLKHCAAIWCCVYASPGHIFYDVFADKKPGWKPKPPANPSEDHPPLD